MAIGASPRRRRRCRPRCRGRPLPCSWWLKACVSDWEAAAATGTQSAPARRSLEGESRRVDSAAQPWKKVSTYQLDDRVARTRAPTTPPSARNGPNGTACFRAPAPWRAIRHEADKGAQRRSRSAAQEPRRGRGRGPSPRRASRPPSPSPRVGQRDQNRQPPAARRRDRRARRGCRDRVAAAIVTATTAPTSSTAFGITRRSRSVRVTTTSSAQRTSPRASSPGSSVPGSGPWRRTGPPSRARSAGNAPRSARRSFGTGPAA